MFDSADKVRELIDSKGLKNMTKSGPARRGRGSQLLGDRKK